MVSTEIREKALIYYQKYLPKIGEGRALFATLFGNPLFGITKPNEPLEIEIIYAPPLLDTLSSKEFTTSYFFEDENCTVHAHPIQEFFYHFLHSWFYPTLILFADTNPDCILHKDNAWDTIKNELKSCAPVILKSLVDEALNNRVYTPSRKNSRRAIWLSHGILCAHLALQYHQTGEITFPVSDELRRVMSYQNISTRKAFNYLHQLLDEIDKRFNPETKQLINLPKRTLAARYYPLIRKLSSTIYQNELTNHLTHPPNPT